MNINTIANQADKLAKNQFNKKAIFNMVNDVVTRDQDSDLVMLSVNEIAALYKYFTPATPAKPKTPIDWLKKALPKDDIRYYLNYIYSDGKRLCATDGHRVHVYKTTEYAPGFYDSNMNQVEDINARYPDIDRVIPSIDQRPNTCVYDQLEFINIDADQSTAKFKQAYVIECDDEKIGINKLYMDHAASIFDNPIISFSDKHSSVLIKSGDKLAVIMPVRL